MIQELIPFGGLQSTPGSEFARLPSPPTMAKPWPNPVNAPRRQPTSNAYGLDDIFPRPPGGRYYERAHPNHGKTKLRKFFFFWERSSKKKKFGVEGERDT